MKINDRRAWGLMGGMGDSYTPQPEYANLVSYWNFDDSTLDFVGDNHLELEGSAASVFAAGKLGNGISLSGNGTYINAIDAANLSFGSGGTDSPFSWSFWINPSTLATANRRIISKRGNTTVGEYEVLISQTTGTIMIFLYSNGSTTVYLAGRSAGGCSVGSYSHVVITYSGSKTLAGIKIYINGVSQALTDITAGSYTGMTNGTSNLAIGNQAWNLANTTGYAGVIDELALFSEELSQSRVDSIYNSGSGLAYVYNPATAVLIVDPLAVLAVRGSYRFATDGDVLKWSSNGGSTYRDYAWGTQYSGGIPVHDLGIDGAFIFSDGTLIFSVENKMYRSTDGLQSAPSVVTTYLADGVTPYPIHTPVSASRPGNYYQMLFYDTKYETVNGTEILVWNNYGNIPIPDKGVAPMSVFYTIDKGATIKTAYRWGQNLSYRDDGTDDGGNTGTLLGDSGNAIKCRHNHSVVRDPDSNDWYFNTGDATSNTEVHWYKMTYDPNTDTWGAPTVIVASGSDATRWKSGGLHIYAGNVYFGSDATNSPPASELGIFTATFAQIGTGGSRLFNSGAYTCRDLKINDNNGRMIAIFGEGYRRRDILFSDSYGASNFRFGSIKDAEVYNGMSRITPINNGYWKINIGTYWNGNWKTLFLRAT